MQAVLKYLLSLLLIFGLGLSVGYSSQQSGTTQSSVVFDRKTTKARQGISAHYLKLARNSAIPIFQITSQSLSSIFSLQMTELFKIQQKELLCFIDRIASNLLIPYHNNAHLKPLPVLYIA